ncbi:MAG: threonine--tRNA ligase [Planctomycetes bacterium]|nr:threonine--tRNA ligase [Planctomycetota bacterium]
MLHVILPDGTDLPFDEAVTPLDVASRIGPGLAKSSVAAVADDRVVGLDFQLPDDGQVQLRILTRKDPEALGVMRHSCAHVMARAVMRLHKGVQLAFGPTVEGGFYYDFGLDSQLSEDDFPAIEAEMQKIVELDEPFECLHEPRDKAIEICGDLGQKYKVEHINEGLANDETLSFYRQGEFIDLCRGPHVPSPKAIAAFKLLSVAGAYWKGDQSREQLQRLYGTAFFSKKDLDAHLEQIAEAKKRDHRVLGKQLKLFSINPMVGSGLVLWRPKGAIIRQLLEEFVKQELQQRGYLPVYSPVIGKVELYQTSGHFPYYRDSQFPPMFEHDAGGLLDALSRRLDDEKQPISQDEERKLIEAASVLGADVKEYKFDAAVAEKKAALEKWASQYERYLLKPMNCPHHIMIYQSQPRSYRELPLRLAEFGTVYRYEQSGELSGMTRVRGFTQDDAHIFCTEAQVPDEFRGCIEMTQFVLQSLGLDNYRVRLGFRDSASGKYVGEESSWSHAEQALVEVCDSLGMAYECEKGEAAFYGPKADFIVTDCIGREWQLGTVQLDYNLPSPDRFGLEFVGSDNSTHQPVMIHRAPLGSMERFIGVLIEHFAGAFPLWLAPEQARILTVSEKSEEYGRQVEARFAAAGLRVQSDYRAEKLGAKIRDAQLELTPYMLIVGPRDQENETVSVRDRIDGDIGALKVDAAIVRLQDEIAARTVRQTFGGNAGLGERGSRNEY